ncbi:MAG TPA: 23S rRNA (adenine(2030)-N(6))-methyltransferase RlmJ [Thermohalobaculum sp.]|nr:23S rRNA (adenine(2030)-N(6))-methyltransferase RlmJ [Thermohalobaculum sp.]
MLSYQHAYHAGSPADLHKHIALAELLTLLTRKARPISYLESHAGRAVYDLASPEALKTGEAARGIGKLPETVLASEGAFWSALRWCRARHGPNAYPGSPMIAQALLRLQDRIALCELHPAEHAALKECLAGPGIAVHRRDGHEGLPGLCPPQPRRGLALIDPSYEIKGEYAQTAETALATLRKWPEGVVMVWYPILPEARHTALTGPIEAAGIGGMLRHEVTYREAPARGMTGSGLIFLNLPHGADKLLRDAWQACSPVF